MNEPLTEDQVIKSLLDKNEQQAEQIAGLNKAYETLTEEDCHTIGLLTEENQRLKTGHCSDCCCARSWKALGVDKYDGKSIPEHIEQLQAENQRLKAWICNECDAHESYCKGPKKVGCNLDRALAAQPQKEPNTGQPTSE